MEPICVLDDNTWAGLKDQVVATSDRAEMHEKVVYEDV
jgi:hypothetical protein